MIIRQTSKEIDKATYDKCVSTDPNGIIYAKSWFLDLVCDQWEVLMLEDYSLVMPLPIKKKWGIKYVYTPPWVQRLGLFGQEAENTSSIEGFYQYLYDHFLWLDYMNHNDHQKTVRNVQARENLVLDLTNSKELIRSAYSSNRQRILKGCSQSLKFGTMTTSEFIDYYQQHGKDSGHRDAVEKLSNLLNADREEIKIFAVVEHNEILAATVLLSDEKRIIYLIGVQNRSARSTGASTFLVDQLIENYAGSKVLLDFEGSMDKGVARFYQSFGASSEPYAYIKKRLI